MKNDKNLRRWLGVDEEYVNYCREERNFAAVLYHLLLDERRLGSFLRLIDQPAPDVAKVGVYFEYAHLRDLWARVAHQEGDAATRNQRYRKAIISMLGMSAADALPTDCKAFNEFFIGEGSKAASAKYIQMPSRWSDSQFRKWSGFDDDRAFAEKACKLKWAFNAKPDLVIDLGGDSVICIEAKLESGIGGYLAKGSTEDGCFRMSQTKLQEFILQDLLGYKTDFVIISKKQDREPDLGWRRYAWHDVFEALLAAQPAYPHESRMVTEFHKRLLQLHE